MSVQRLVRAAEIYGINPQDLLPVSNSSSSFVIDLDRLSDGESDTAERYVAAIHLLRSASTSAEIRASDRAIISSFLEVESQRVSGEA